MKHSILPKIIILCTLLIWRFRDLRKLQIGILQTAAKFQDNKFNMYLNPLQATNDKASKITGLRNILGKSLIFKWQETM